jgi:hypothetical protein
VASRGGVLRPAAAAAAVAVLAGGCATVPSVGRPAAVTGASGQAQQFVQPIPPVPNAGWKPQQIVQGFLAASASITDNHAAARRFLAPNLRKNFQPSWAVTVVGSLSTSLVSRVGPPNLQNESTLVTRVTLTGQQLASISNIGQYLDNPGSHTYTFMLAKINGQWLISNLPRTSLLLTKADFEEVYQPRNLYFWAPSGAALVPEPVFAPQQTSYADVATNLVNALLMTNQYSRSWLVSATSTAFPSGTTLVGNVAITGPSAVVNLTGAVSHSGPQQLRHMAAQLVTTLTSGSYLQPPIARSVVLEIDGKPVDVKGQQVQEPADYSDLLPSFPASFLYFVGSSGAVMALTTKTSGPVTVPVAGAFAHAKIPFTTLAVAPAGPTQLAGAVAAGGSCEIYYGGLTGTAPPGHLLLPGRPGPCASLSWDTLGDIWAVTAQDIWVLPPGGRKPVSVLLPQLPGSKPPPYRVLALRVAADGVRAAMLVQTQSGARQLLLSAVIRNKRSIQLGPTVTIGTNLTPLPTALSWYDPDHLIVLAGSQLYEIPANGGAAVPVGPVPPGTESVTAAGPGEVATGGLTEVLKSSGPDEIQQPVVKGTSPAYPG